MRFKIIEQLKDFQKQYCVGCLYAKVDKVGTGKACCTCSGMPHIHDSRCSTRKSVSAGNVLLSCK